jgi:hypothetical protein
MQRNVGTVYGGHERLDLKIKSFRLHLHRRAHRGLLVQQGTNNESTVPADSDCLARIR